MRRLSPALLLVLSGCGGAQSALAPLGVEADEIGLLFGIVAATCIAVLVIVTVLTLVAAGPPGRLRAVLRSPRAILIGGLVFPAVVLTGFLIYGLVVLQAGSARAARSDGLEVTVTGKQWWWRVVYTDATGQRIESANELRLPVGQRVTLHLASDDVIHSFWVPRLGGKLDMIPGRPLRLTLEAKEAGIGRGQCAEYCGGAHAFMSFYAIAMPQAEFETWLAAEARPAVEPDDAQAQSGKAVFDSSGCGACHTVRGTAAAGKIGPDLTHVGGRMSLAAATLPNDAASFARWIRDSRHIKPENLMPPFGQLSDTELADLARYLEALQ
jgi:cytochrome c oxidase subunit 2